MNAIYLKELSSYFKSARGYICLGLYYLFGGQFLLMQIRYQGTNDIAAVFTNMYLVVLLTLPILTMRLLAEEKRTRTDQALFTAPVSLGEIVWGKFLAALTVFFMGISVFIVYFVVLGSMSSPDMKMFLGNMLGMLLLGSAVISIGLFVSALTESQMLAAIGTFACMLLVIFLDSISGILPSSLSVVSKALAVLSLEERFSDFTSGLLDPANVIYFVSIIVVFNFLTIRVLDKNRWTSSKRMKNAGMSMAVTAVFLVVVVLVNIVSSLLIQRLPAIDLTDTKLYQLSEKSIDVIENIDTDMNIIVCYDQKTLRDTDYGKQIDEFLKEYNRRNSRIQVRFADLLKEPELAAEYSEYGIAEGSIVFTSEYRTKIVNLNDCVEAVANATGTGYNYEAKSEQVLTSGILNVTDHALMQVTVLTGHQDLGCTDIINYLQENNYEIKEQNISTEEIDPSSEAVFLLAPMSDYSAEEMKKLDRYLDNDGSFGKKMFYIAAYNQPELPSLNSFLKEWGIDIGDSLILETDSSNIYDQQGFMYTASFTKNSLEWLEKVKNPSLPVLGYYCKPVTALWEENDNRTAKELIRTPETCILYQMETGLPTNTTKQGYGLAVIGDRLKYEGEEERRSYVAAFGSTSMFSSSETVSSNFNNKDFTVALINSLTGKQNGVSIPSVSFSAQKLNVTQAAYQLLSIVLGILLPVLVLLAGAVMTVHRRRL